MEFNAQSIKFNREERHVTGLPERVPIRAAHVTFSRVRDARQKCFEAFRELLTCDLELLSDIEAKTLPLYPERLDCLDEISQKLVAVVAPQIIAELQDNPEALAASVAAVSRRDSY